MSGRQRIVEMDMARGLATIAVVLIHITADPLLGNCRSGGVTWLFLVLNVAARFAVPLFVVLSGMGLTISDRKSEGYFRFVSRRLWKIVPLYVVWSVIYTLLCTNNNGWEYFGRGVTIKKVLCDLWSGDACYHLYFVPLIVQFYLLYPLLKRFLKTNWGLGLSTAVTFTLICIGHYTETPPRLAFLFDVQNPLMWVFYFALGVRMADDTAIKAVRRAKKASPWIIAATFIGMTALVRHVSVSANSIDAGIDSMGPIVMLYTALFICWAWSREWNNGCISGILKWISRNSYIIYLSHAFPLILFLEYHEQLGIWKHELAYGVGSLVAVVLAAVALSWISPGKWLLARKSLNPQMNTDKH